MFLSRAVELDPGFAVATACLGYAHCVRILHGISPDAESDIETALRLGPRALKLDKHEPFAHLAIGRASIFSHRLDEAFAVLDRAILPNVTVGYLEKALLVLRGPGRDLFLGGLGKAGVPD